MSPIYVIMYNRTIQTHTHTILFENIHFYIYVEIHGLHTLLHCIRNILLHCL